MIGTKNIKPFSNKRIEKGSFYPATTRTAQVAEYENYKYGWFINFNMNNFQGYAPEIAGKTRIFPAERYNTMAADVAGWADAAAARGVDYVIFTVLDEFGFLMYDSKLNSELPTIPWDADSGAPSPQRPFPYCATNYGDFNITEKVCIEFRKRGIEVYPYVISTYNMNLQEPSPGAYVTGQRINTWFDWQIRAVQEMIMRFRFKGIWLDTGATGTLYVSQFYNAIKSINPSCLLIANVGNQKDFNGFPYDIQSIEEHFIFEGGDSYKTNTRSHNGVNYYVGQEICAIPYSRFSQWYKVDDDCPVQPVVSPFGNGEPFVKNLLTSKVSFQNIVNQAKQFNRPFTAGVWVDRSGKLDMQAVNFLDKIDFTRP